MYLLNAYDGCKMIEFCMSIIGGIGVRSKSWLGG